MEPLVEKCDQCGGKGERRRELKAGDWVLDRKGYLFRVAIETSPGRDRQLRWVRQNGDVVYVGCEIDSFPDKDESDKLLTPYEAAALIAGLKVEDAWRIEALKGEEVRVFTHVDDPESFPKAMIWGKLYRFCCGAWEDSALDAGAMRRDCFRELHGPEKAAFLLKHPLGVGNGK